MCLAVSLSIQISLTKFKALSIQVNALNSTCRPLTLTFRGPIKLMVTSSHGAIRTLIWVGDHDCGMLIYIFGNLCTSVHQSDTKAWDDDDVGSTSHIPFSHQDVPLHGGTI
jgi:hypothetical protein